MRGGQRSTLGGVHLDPGTSADVVEQMRDAFAQGVGGRVAITRSSAAAGARLTWSLSAALAADGRSVYLLGGVPEMFGRREGAHQAAAVLSATCPGITIAGHASPRAADWAGRATPPGGLPRGVAAICDEIVDADPDVVYLGVDPAGQERVVEFLRLRLPRAWFVGWPGIIDMITGRAEGGPCGADRVDLLGAASRTVRLLTGAVATRVGGRSLRLGGRGLT